MCQKIRLFEQHTECAFTKRITKPIGMFSIDRSPKLVCS